MNEVAKKGKSPTNQEDATFNYSHQDTRIERYILVNVVVTKLEYAREVQEENSKLEKRNRKRWMGAGSTKLGYSKTTSIPAFRAEFGVYPFETET